MAIDEKFVEAYSTDELLLKSVPTDVRIIKVKAFGIKWTHLLGLGSLSIRSFWFYLRMGDKLLTKEKFDLVYFSTTAFHLLALGTRWKRKFKVPFVVDIQDPWRRDYYLSKPKKERPPKFFLTYNLDKILEARTIPNADGIISVSKNYCDIFLKRYPNLLPRQCIVIPFGGAIGDFDIVSNFVSSCNSVKLLAGKINVVYVGRGGNDMEFAVRCLFAAVVLGLKEDPVKFSNLYFWFLGTSYAPKEVAIKTIEPIAAEFGLSKMVYESTDRVPYFETLWLLQQAEILFIPGSNDTSYTASKIYPYILANRPLIAIFHECSSVVDVFKKTDAGKVCVFESCSKIDDIRVEIMESFIEVMDNLPFHRKNNCEALKEYSDETMTQRQADFFNTVSARFVN